MQVQLSVFTVLRQADNDFVEVDASAIVLKDGNFHQSERSINIGNLVIYACFLFE